MYNYCNFKKELERSLGRVTSLLLLFVFTGRIFKNNFHPIQELCSKNCSAETHIHLKEVSKFFKKREVVGGPDRKKND